MHSSLFWKQSQYSCGFSDLSEKERSKKIKLFFLAIFTIYFFLYFYTPSLYSDLRWNTALNLIPLSTPLTGKLAAVVYSSLRSQQTCLFKHLPQFFFIFIYISLLSTSLLFHLYLSAISTFIPLYPLNTLHSEGFRCSQCLFLACGGGWNNYYSRGFRPGSFC